jgi:hypothetical protein
MKITSLKLKGHPNERTLVLLYKNRLEKPEPIQDHILLCEQCLDELDRIAVLIDIFTANSLPTVTPRPIAAAG